MGNNDIDFVLLWVDGSDKEWQKERAKYEKECGVKRDSDDKTDSDIRFRDFGLLKYWFRGVEKFAPWVHKIFLITNGQVPDFLNLKNEKIVLIKHSDIMKKEDLPTFNSNAIEMNITKIKDLSECFVLFNDDIYIVDKVSPNDFFAEGLPRDEYAEDAIQIDSGDGVIPYNLLNEMKVINDRYEKKQVYRRSFYKYFNPLYGMHLLRTLLLCPYKRFVGIRNAHISQSFLKSTFEKLEKIDPKIIDETSSHRFRCAEDYAQYMARYLQLVEGKFIPRRSSFGKYYEISNDNEKIISAVTRQRYKIVCLNDVDDMINFVRAKMELKKAFDGILPNKSGFEK